MPANFAGLPVRSESGEAVGEGRVGAQALGDVSDAVGVLGQSLLVDVGDRVARLVIARLERAGRET